MKTIAVKEPTWEKLKNVMKEENLPNFDLLIDTLIKKFEDVPKSMFGIDKGSKPYTLKEHEEFQRDFHG